MLTSGGESEGSGNQSVQQGCVCDLCKSRWKYLNRKELQEAMEQQTSKPETAVKCTCGVPAHRWKVHKAGPTCGRHLYRCQRRICEFFMWDPTEQAQLGTRLAHPDTQENADMELEMEQKVKEKAKLEMMFEDKAKQMKEGYQQEIAQLQQQMHQQAAWMQSFMAQAHGGFEMVAHPTVTLKVE